MPPRRSGVPAPTACGSTPGSRRATRSAPTTTRCSPRWSAGPRPAEAALRRLAGALERAEIHGVRTNRDLLVEVLRHPRFRRRAAVDRLPRAPRPRRPVTAAGRRRHADRCRRSPRRSPSPSGPGATRRAAGIPAGWRNVASQPQRTVVRREDVAEWTRPPGTGSAGGALTAELSGRRGRHGTSDADNSVVPRSACTSTATGSTSSRRWGTSP